MPDRQSRTVAILPVRERLERILDGWLLWVLVGAAIGSGYLLH